MAGQGRPRWLHGRVELPLPRAPTQPWSPLSPAITMTRREWLATPAAICFATSSRIVLHRADPANELSDPIRIEGFRNLRLEWRERWTAPVTWEKHSGNPILAAPRTTPCVVRIGDRLRLSMAPSHARSVPPLRLYRLPHNGLTRIALYLNSARPAHLTPLE